MLDLTPIRAISLDLDDTLWPVWPIIARAEEALHAWLEHNAPGAAALGQDREVLRRIRQQVQLDWPDRGHDLAGLRQEAIRRLLRQSGEPEQLAEAGFEVFHAERQRVELFDDAMPLLQHLSGRYPLLAITNGTADVRRVGLGEWFEHAVNAPTLGLAKPEPGIFHHAAQLAGLAPHQVLHIGDDSRLDAWGARNAGMAAIWLNREGKDWDQPGEPVPAVGSLSELLVWFESGANR
jgi:putative hydrolase of the HAD superfamily